jgi:hypothetical protein
LMTTLRKEARITCLELKFYPFKALVLPTFTYGDEIWGSDSKKLSLKDSF